MEWDDLVYAAALAEAGSIRRAGSRLGVHGATVARHIERLEARLGVRLFSRTRNGMVPTEAGQRALAAHARLAADLVGLEQELKGYASEVAGDIVLRVAEPIAAAWLATRLSGFSGRFPEITLQLEVFRDMPDTPAAWGDVAIVLTENPPDTMVGRRLGRLLSRGYRLRPPVGGEDIVAPGDAAERSGLLACDSLAVRLAACRAGVGTVVLPSILGDDCLELERDEGFPAIAPESVWLLSRPESRGIVRLQALIGYLQEVWQADRLRLEGVADA